MLVDEGSVDRLTGLERLRHLRRAERFDRDDAHRRLRLLDRRADA